MDQKQRVALSLYALIYSLAALTAFRFGDFVPVPTGYLLLIIIYVIPVWLAMTHQLGERLTAVLLILTPLLPALIVVDPLEIGFYGYDPYVTLRTALEFRANGPVHIARSGSFAWPGFYAFLWAVTSLTGLPVATVGKYLPLVAVGTPLLFYLFASRVISRQTAFVAAMGFAGVRTLYTFQVKFLDETTAFVLFFTLLFLLVVRSVSRTSAVSYLALLVASGAVLTHHYVGALVAFLLVLWDVSEREIFRVGRLRDLEWPFSRLTLVTGGILVLMIFLVTPQFLGFLVSVADVSTSPSSEVLETPQGPDATPTPDTPQTSDPTPTPDTRESTPGSDRPTATPTSRNGSGAAGTPGAVDASGQGDGLLQTIQNFPVRFWKLLATNIVLIALLSVVVTTFRSWALDSHPALLVSGIFGCILALGYGFSVAFGPIIPLDPSRYLLYMTGLLLVPAGHALRERELPVESNAIFSTLVVLLILTQLIVVPSVVMYSDQGQTHVGEGHYSPSQFAASDWLGEYGGDQVVGWESGVWRANGIERAEFGSTDGGCSVLRVWRQDEPQQNINTADTVLYDGGPVQLYQCRE